MRKLKVTEMGRKSVEQFRDSHKMPLVVVLDHVRSLYNVGSVFRTSDAFLVKGICLCGITARPPHPEIHKTALGAEDLLKWQRFSDVQEAIDYYHRQNIKVFALEQGKESLNIADHHDYPDSIALILGEEVHGIPAEILKLCDGQLEIPMCGQKESFNVSVATGIALWELRKPDLSGTEKYLHRPQ